MKSQSKSLLLMLFFAIVYLTATGIPNFFGEAQAAPSGPHELFHSPKTDIDIEFVNQIGGPVVASAVRGNYAYAGIGPRLVVLNVANPAFPVSIGQHFLPGPVNDVALAGEYVYVTTTTYHTYDELSSRLHVINMGDPANPTEIGSVSIAVGGACYFCEKNVQVVVAGNTAYVTANLTAGEFIFHVIDISDPANPVEVGHYKTTGFFTEVTAAGQYAYIAGLDDNEDPDPDACGLFILDVADPANPTEVGFFIMEGTCTNGGLEASGDNVFVTGGADGYVGLYILNIADPIHPTEIGNYKVPLGESSRFPNLDIEGSHAYIMDEERSLHIIDVSDPSNPTGVSQYEGLSGSSMYRQASLTVAGSHVYVCNNDAGLFIIDVTDPANPLEKGYYKEGPALVNDVRIAGSHGYVVGEAFYSLDLNSPANPSILGFYQRIPEWRGHNLVVADHYGFVGEKDGLLIVDISNPDTPNKVNYTLTGRNGPAVAVSGKFVLAGHANGWLRVLDITNPSHPVEVYSQKFDAPVYDIKLAGDYAYICVERVGLYVYNITDPTNPIEVGSIDIALPKQARGVALTEDHAYVAAGRSLEILDITDPANPALLDSRNTQGFAENASVMGDYLFLGEGGAGVRIFDISNPSDPQEVASYDTPGNASDIDFIGSYLYVADSLGLVILQTSGIPTPTPTVTPTSTITPTPTTTPTPTVTPTSTPNSPWAVWHDIGEVLVPPQGVEVVIDYGSFTASSPLAAEIDGPVQFDNGLNTMTDTVPSAGNYTLSLHPAPDALPEQPFTLDVTLPDVNLQRNGMIAHPYYMPVILKPS